MDGPLDVDEIWKSLGTWGKYQLRQLTVCLVAVIPVAFHLLSIVFIAYRPKFACNETTQSAVFPDREGDNSSYPSYRFVYHQCSIDVFTNDTNSTFVTTTPCVSGYKYDVAADNSIVTEWELFCSGGANAELSQTMIILGQGVGSTLFASLADKFGRKPVHILCHIALFVISFATAWTPNYAVFVLMRFLIGTVQAGTGFTVAVLAIESVPVESRYKWEIADLVCWTTGVVLVTPFAYLFRNTSWRYLQMAFAIGSTYSLVEYWMLEESLRWLLANGKTKEAERIIRKAAKMNGKDFDKVIQAASKKAKELQMTAVVPKHDVPGDEILPMIPIEGLGINGVPSENREYPVSPTGDHGIQASEKKPEQYNTLTIFKHKRILLNSLIIWYTWTTNSLVYYALILTSTSLSGDIYINFLIMGVLEYPAAFVQYHLINRIGRRNTCLFFHALAGVSLAISTVCMLYQDDLQPLETISRVFNFVGKFAITGSFSTIFLYTPELYPTNLRSAGLGLASTCSRIGGMLAPYAGTLMDIVQWLPGTIFSVMCFLTVYLTSLLPETMGHELPTTIEELKLWYKENTRSKQKPKKSTHL